MPLKKGKSKKTIAKNIKTEYKALRKKGKTKKKSKEIASAIAYSKAGLSKNKKKKSVKKESFDNVVNDYLKLFIFDEAIMPTQQPAQLSPDEQKAANELEKKQQEKITNLRRAKTDPRTRETLRAGIELGRMTTKPTNGSTSINKF